MNSKFRVWDGETMLFPNTDNRLVIDQNGLWEFRSLTHPESTSSWDFAGDVLASSKWDSCALMHYTGLDDAEGTPIYQGDIVKHVYADEPAVVEWSDWYPGFDLDNVQTEAVPDALRFGTVVGNRFQPPELLND